MRVAEPFSDAALEDLRTRFIAGADLDPENHIHGSGIPLILEELDRPFMPHPEAYWYEANLIFRYDRSATINPIVVRCAEWLETAVPHGEMWYGDDCSDESINPFGPNERVRLSKKEEDRP